MIVHEVKLRTYALDIVIIESGNHGPIVIIKNRKGKEVARMRYDVFVAKFIDLSD